MERTADSDVAIALLNHWCAFWQTGANQFFHLFGIALIPVHASLAPTIGNSLVVRWVIMFIACLYVQRFSRVRITEMQLKLFLSCYLKKAEIRPWRQARMSTPVLPVVTIFVRHSATCTYHGD